MAGEAKTNQFMLGTATVMIGPQADVFDLRSANHAIGLVKNFSITAEPQFTELRQGVQNSLVSAVLTQNTVRASMEVYEYTARNLGYALNLNGDDYATMTEAGTLDSETAADSAVLALGTGEGASFSAGDYVVIDGGNELIFTRKILSIATDSLTVDINLPVAIPVGSTVRRVNAMDIGSRAEPEYYSMKIVGQFADGTDCVLLLPKVRITGGFTLQFQTDNFGNLPFEVACYDKVSTDPHYADFKDKQALLLRQ